MIIYAKRFELDLWEIIDLISKDSLAMANKFADDLFNKIYQIQNFPLSHRKSITADDDVRDLIFKGYVVVFKIQKSDIYILGIFNAMLEIIGTDF